MNYHHPSQGMKLNMDYEHHGISGPRCQSWDPRFSDER
uniref:Uncharacterized protein n=1 Tax=Arundo donax TaxID=35708 RepID=A0A0A8YG79_ARUDO